MSIAAAYRPFLELAREAAIDLAAEIAKVGLSLAELNDAARRLSPHQGRALVNALGARYAKTVGHAPLGLLAAERFLPADIDLLGYMIRHSPHPMAAAESIAKHARLIGDTADVRLVTRGTRVTMRIGLTGGKLMAPDGSDYALAHPGLSPRAPVCLRAPADCFVRFCRAAVARSGSAGATSWASARSAATPNNNFSSDHEDVGHWGDRNVMRFRSSPPGYM